MTLRPYQLDLIRDVRAAWASGARVVCMQLATGGGKTRIVSEIVRSAGVPTAILAHRSELVAQLSLALARDRVPHHLICSDADRRDICTAHLAEYSTCLVDPNALVTVASVQTLVRRDVSRWQQTVRLWVCDEGHHALRDNTWGAVIDRFDHPDCHGLLPTATPLRADGRGLGRDTDGFADTIVYGPSGKWLIDQGYLSRYRVAVVDSHMRDFLGSVAASGDWSQATLRQASQKSQIVGDVVQSYWSFACGQIGITFATDVATAREMADSYRAGGVPAAVLTGESSLAERRDTWARLIAREILQVVAVDVISEGVDVPAVEAVTMARPTASLGLYLQQLGRGLRPKPGGGPLQLIDHVGNFLAHNGGPDAPRAWTLDRRIKRQAHDPDEIPLTICLDPLCGQPFPRFRRSCPYCGRERGPPARRDGPEHVDGMLSMLDESVLARLRGDAAVIDLSTEDYLARLVAQRCPQAGIARNLDRHAERQSTQRELRAAMAAWGGHRLAEGLTDDEMQALFWYRYGVDVLSAMALGATDARALMERLI